MIIRTLAVTITALCLLITSLPSYADIVDFRLYGRVGFGLRTGNEIPAASGNGSGNVLSGITYDTDLNLLTMDIGWGSGNGFNDLTGNVTVMHIHGPANINQNAGALINLHTLAGFNGSGTNGSLNDSVTLTAGQESNLLAELLYINVHTSANGGGEIRGNLFVIPEPSSAGLLILGLALSGFVVRRRR